MRWLDNRWIMFTLLLVSCRIACQVSGGGTSFFQKESKRQCGTKTENVRPFESISVAEVKTQSCRTAAKFAKLFLFSLSQDLTEVGD